MSSVWCELALLNGQPQTGVLIDIADGRFASIETAVSRVPSDATRLDGFTIPGLANAHSHAFHRALRSRTQADRGTFWTWRDLMYRAAARLDPESYHGLARATFAEMAQSGITCVGEFHYLHHQPDGTAYRDPNAMGEAILAAADEAGIRITLLDTLYLHGGLDESGHTPTTGTQRRFSDRTPDAWVDRVNRMQPSDNQRIAAAIHSVRAVDPRSMAVVADWAAAAAAPIHAHVSEQRGENEACLAAFGITPVGMLAEAGVLGSKFSAVHATHVDHADISRLAEAGSTVVMCPTTERDLGDGIGPFTSLASSGIATAVGSDSQAVIDLLEEARALELNERIDRCERGLHPAKDLLAMATVHGHRSLGWTDAGAISLGNRADLVTITLDSVRMAGTPGALAVEATVFAATAGDITDVFVDGRHVVSEGVHGSINVATELDRSIKALMDDD